MSGPDAITDSLRCFGNGDIEGIEATLAQLFRPRAALITESLLVFDPGEARR